VADRLSGTSLALILSSGLLKLALAAIVGNPEVLIWHNIVQILALCVFAHMIALAARSVTPRIEVLQFKVAGPLVAVGFAGVAYLCIATYHAWLPVLVSDLYVLWTPTFYYALHLGTLALVFGKLLLWRYPLAPPNDAGHDIGEIHRGIVGLAMVVLLALPMVHKSGIWQKFPLAPDWPPGKFSGDISRDLEALASSGKLWPAVYPAEILSYLRTALPPNQTILGRDTFAAVVATTHFTNLLAHQGNVPSAYTNNWRYLIEFSGKDQLYSLVDFLESQDGLATLQRLLAVLEVDILIADKQESEVIVPLWNDDQRLRSLFDPVFEHDGYVIYRVNGAKKSG